MKTKYKLMYKCPCGAVWNSEEYFTVICSRCGRFHNEYKQVSGYWEMEKEYWFSSRLWKKLNIFWSWRKVGFVESGYKSPRSLREDEPDLDVEGPENVIHNDGF